MGFSSCDIGKTIVVKEGGISLQEAVDIASETKKTIVIKGTIKSKTVEISQPHIKIVGKKKAVVDFSPTFYDVNTEMLEWAAEQVESGDHKMLAARTEPSFKEIKKILDAERGFVISGNYNSIENLVIQNAADNGICITGSYNTFKKVDVSKCHDSGVLVSKGASYNTFISCYSHDNFDEWNGGNEADGFSVKLEAGEGNKFESCKAEYNSSDGWDLCGAHGDVEMKNCRANNNGFGRDGKRLGYFSEGTGFKLGGILTLDDYKVSKKLSHVVENSIATNNASCGFERIHQFGKVRLVNCTSTLNGKFNYNLPLEGRPAILVKSGLLGANEKMLYGPAYLVRCQSGLGSVDISGAFLDAYCTGFSK